MNFLELAQARHSVRKYQQRPVEPEKVQTILEAGRVAPTALNKQPQRFLVVGSREGLDKLGLAADLHGAPLAVVVCSLDDQAWVRPQDGHHMTEIDASIATTLLMLAAWELGVASCWISWFDPAVVRQEFYLPDNVIPINILVLGYSDQEAAAPGRHADKRIALKDMVWPGQVPQLK